VSIDRAPTAGSWGSRWYPATNSSARRSNTLWSTARYSSSLESKCRYTMSLVMPDAAAISSMEVAAYPPLAKAAAAPERIAAWRSARGSGPVGGAAAVVVAIGIRESIPSWVYPSPEPS
jgi:hypothetical protein